jgi:gliding motility-associated-like protein
LPALPAGSTYHDAPAGGGTTIAVGTLINAVGAHLIYIYAQSGTTPNCTTEGDFTVTVYQKPAIPNPVDVSVCSNTGYILPALPAGSTYHSAAGGAPGTIIPVGTNINAIGVNTIWVFAESGTTPNCTSEGDFTVTVYQTPTAINPADVTVCSNTGYPLPALPAGSTYHNAPGGAAATLIAVGTIINTIGANTIYVFSETGTTPNCTAEGDFVVTVNQMPTTPNPTDVVACDGYLLPALPAGSTYHSAPGGAAATLLPVGTNINTVGVTTIYVFAETGTTPNCTAEGDFTVTINATPTTPNPADVTVCSATGYILPPLPANSTYHSASGGAVGTLIAVGTNINTVGVNTIYVFADTGTTPNCTAEGDFTVTVNQTPATPVPSDVVACDSYILPALPLGSTYHSAPGGAAATFIANGATINTIGVTTIYVFAETGTTPNCTAEGDFTVTINATPATPNPSDVTVCDSYTLPALPAGSTYHAGTAAGPVLNAGAVITTTQAIVIVAETGTSPNCTAQGDFTVTVNPTPVAEAPADVVACNSYVLPPLNVGSYFDGPNGTGNAYAGGAVITAAHTTMYVYAQSGTSPNCVSQNSFDIDIFFSPVANTPADIDVCDDNNDGFSCLFDLTASDAQVTGGVPGLVVTYHETLTDAQTGANPIANPSAYCNIVADDQTLYPRLYDPGAPLCYSTTTLVLHVNPVPVPNPVITDYQLCDVNNPGDGVEPFDLPSKDLEILNGQTGVTVSYYQTQGDALSGTSPIAGPYVNTSNPQLVWVRLEYGATGCFGVSSFNLVVNPLPQVFTAAMNACGTSAGIAEFDLTTNDLVVSGGVVGLSVGYYEAQADADAGTNAIIDPSHYTNISNPQTVYVRVVNDATGCFAITTVTLTVSQGPAANTPGMLQVCDPNNDCFAGFDLTLSEVDILGAPAPAGVTITYHETLTDAQNGDTAIANPGNYTNIVCRDQVIYVRVAYDATGCYTVVELALHVNDTPQATEGLTIEVCDNDTDGVGTFDLAAIVDDILGSYDPAGHTVSFHLTQGDAIAGTAAISNVLGFQGTTQTIWVRLRDNATGCFDVVELGLVVNPLPLLPPTPTGAAVPYSKCDYDNPGDEIEIFDLTTQIPGILNGQTGISVNFYETQGDAQGGTGAIVNTTAYANIANAQTLWVALEDTTTHCRVLTTMDLRVEPLPVLVPPADPVRLCDPDGDGFAQFDLDGLAPAMLQGAPNIIVSFHETLTDAQSGANPESSPYLNIVPFVQPMYVRAVNSLTGCWSVMTIELNVIPSPVVPVLEDQVKCDTDSNNQDGLTSFDLTTQEAAILAAQLVPGGIYDITYHLTQGDADAGTNPIIQDTNFINSTNPQTIWVRVTGRDSECYNIGSFDLRVSIPLALTTPTQLTICDDGPTSAVPQAVFDLTVKDNEITGGAIGYTVAYYVSQGDAQAGTNPIADPTAYTNIANAQTLFVAVSGPGPSFCRSFTTLTIRVLPLPVPLSDDIPVLEACDDNLPVGTELFDLTTNEAYIRDNDPQLAFSYYTTLTDAQAGTNAIVPVTAFETGTGTIYIRVERNTEPDYLGDFCYVILEQQVIVNPLPALVVADAIGCDASGSGLGTYEFTLSDYNAGLLAAGQDVGDFTFTHYLSLADAQAGTGQLPDVYTNIPPSPQDITVKVVDNLTGCVNYTTLTLKVLAGATAANVVAAAVCDTDSDGLMDVDLTQFDAQVLGAQDPLVFTVAYFASAADALAGTGVLAGPYNTASATLYAVVTNTATGCRSAAATVGVTIEPLVDIHIRSVTPDGISNSICVDFLTGQLLSGLTLDSGLVNDGTYVFEWALGGTPIPGATASTYAITDPLGAGNYTVTATTALGCVSTSDTFTVIQSGPAAIPVGTQGYTVSGAFEQNQTVIITVQGYGQYHYQLDNGPILDNGGVFTNVPAGLHTVHIYDMEGDGAVHCDFITISGIQSIDYPHYFTPNGDGINDTWLITGLDDSAKIYIFDRYGKLVKQIAPNGLGWDGTYNGQPLPSTDYWFTVEYNELNSTTVITKEFKAHFSLKR